MTPPSIAVVGSANLDLVVRCDRLPRPGETLSGATFARYPGGKGANQAVAAARLGADVVFTGAVGRDPFVEEALAGLRGAEVVLRVVERDAPTGVALIEVAADGETTIVVAPGANAELEARRRRRERRRRRALSAGGLRRRRAGSGRAGTVRLPQRRSGAAASTSSRTSSSSTGSSTRSSVTSEH